MTECTCAKYVHAEVLRIKGQCILKFTLNVEEKMGMFLHMYTVVCVYIHFCVYMCADAFR